MTTRAIIAKMPVRLVSNIGLESRMIGKSRPARSPQFVGQLIHTFAGGAVDNRCAFDIGFIQDQLGAAAFAGFHQRRERQIGPIEPVNPYQGLAQLEIGDDLLLHPRRGRGREGRDRDVEKVP